MSEGSKTEGAEAHTFRRGDRVVFTDRCAVSAPRYDPAEMVGREMVVSDAHERHLWLRLPSGHVILAPTEGIEHVKKK